MLKIKIGICAAVFSALINVGCLSNASGDQPSGAVNQLQVNAETNLADNNAVVRSAGEETFAGTVFKGTIGNRSKFEMTLRRGASNQLSGSYFYLKSGAHNSLVLTGKIDRDGKFELRETDLSGKQTGLFTGTWKSDANSPGSWLEGEWLKTGAKQAQAFGATEQLIWLPAAVKIVPRQIEEVNKVKRFEIYAEYPEIADDATSSKYAAFNRTVKKLVTEPVNGFRRVSLALTTEDFRDVPAAASNDLNIGYDFVYADENLLSLNFVFYRYEAGAAHGNSATTTVNYDLKNDRELKLAELFKPGVNYLEPISAFVSKELQARQDPESGENLGLAQDIFADGATPTTENYAAWNLTAKGLMFTFDPYQVGPYASGMQTVIVPFAKLKELLRQDGAANRIRVAR